MSKPAIDLTGQQFGHWTVLKRTANRGVHPMWLCRCTCGVQRPVPGNNLRSGGSTSCGHLGVGRPVNTVEEAIVEATSDIGAMKELIEHGSVSRYDTLIEIAYMFRTKGAVAFETWLCVQLAKELDQINL